MHRRPPDRAAADTVPPKKNQVMTLPARPLRKKNPAQPLAGGRGEKNPAQSLAGAARGPAAMT